MQQLKDLVYIIIVSFILEGKNHRSIELSRVLSPVRIYLLSRLNCAALEVGQSICVPIESVESEACIHTVAEPANDQVGVVEISKKALVHVIHKSIQITKLRLWRHAVVPHPSFTVLSSSSSI